MNGWLDKIKKALQVGSKEEWTNNPEALGQNKEKGYDDWESLNPLIPEEVLKYSDEVVRDRNKIRDQEMSQPQPDIEKLKAALINYQIQKNMQLQNR